MESFDKNFGLLIAFGLKFVLAYSTAGTDGVAWNLPVPHHAVCQRKTDLQLLCQLFYRKHMGSTFHSVQNETGMGNQVFVAGGSLASCCSLEQSDFVSLAVASVSPGQP